MACFKNQHRIGEIGMRKCKCTEHSMVSSFYCPICIPYVCLMFYVFRIPCTVYRCTVYRIHIYLLNVREYHPYNWLIYITYVNICHWHSKSKTILDKCKVLSYPSNFECLKQQTTKVHWTDEKNPFESILLLLLFFNNFCFLFHLWLKILCWKKLTMPVWFCWLWFSYVILKFVFS